MKTDWPTLAPMRSELRQSSFCWRAMRRSRTAKEPPVRDAYWRLAAVESRRMPPSSHSPGAARSAFSLALRVLTSSTSPAPSGRGVTAADGGTPPMTARPAREWRQMAASVATDVDTGGALPFASAAAPPPPPSSRSSRACAAAERRASAGEVAKRMEKSAMSCAQGRRRGAGGRACPRLSEPPAPGRPAGGSPATRGTPRGPRAGRGRARSRRRGG